MGETPSDVMSPSALPALGAALRAAGRIVVWTNGCFDLLHAGHVHSLRAARALGDVLIVGVNSDASVRRLKGPPRPIVPAAERAALVAALACVDRVVVFDEDTPEICLRLLRPAVHCKGADYAPPSGKQVPEAPLVEGYGGRVAFLPLVPGLSTTELIERVRALPGAGDDLGPRSPDALAPDWAKAVAALRARRLLVVGDLMLDEYVAGAARRVSPEAPVPIVEGERRWASLGGAANAATNIASLSGKPVLGGVIGADGAGDTLSALARRDGIDTSGLVTDSARPTTTKLRVLACGQQVARVDTESAAPLSPDTEAALIVWAERAVTECDAVLLSDYGKGVFANDLAGRVIRVARRVGRPVIVDPRGRAPTRYTGATVVKPNVRELGELTGRPVRSRAELAAAGQALAEALPGTAVVATCGADGLALFWANRPPLQLGAAPARRVCDVTGAGDTLAAVLALGLAGGLTLETAARLANAAAGLVVGEVGTAVARPAELIASLREGAPSYSPFGD